MKNNAKTRIAFGLVAIAFLLVGGASSGVFPFLITSPTDGQVLVYSAANSRWQNGAGGGSGGTPGGADGDLQYNNAGAFGGYTPGTGVAAALQVAVGAAGGPVLFNGVGGTPSSITLTGGSGLPISGIAGLGTGVGTALAINVGTTGAVVVLNGAGGTPNAINLTNGTALPISGIASLGTGVGTWLATPSSANLAAALTDETGTGVSVFGTSPAITTSITTASTTFALLNTTATTVNAFGAATTVNLGASATMIVNFGGSTTASELRFLEPSGSGTNYTALKAGAQAANITYVFPAAVGAAGTYLKDVAGDGILSWATPAGSGTVASGTINTMAKYTATGTSVGNSLLTDDATTLTYSGTGGIVSAGSATGIVTITGVTSGSFKITGADAMAQIVTMSVAAQTSGASTITVPDLAGASQTFSFIGKAETITGAKTFGAAGNVGKLIVAGTTSGTTIVNAAAVAGSTTTILPNANSTLPVLSQQITFIGPTAARTITLLDAAYTTARQDAAQTFTGVQSMTSPDITTSLTSPSTTFALLNVTPTTVNAFGATTTLNIGASATMILNFGGSTTASQFRFLEPSGSGTNFTAFKAQAQSADITYTLPATVASAGQYLTDAAGNGTLSWATPGGSGTVTASGGTLTANSIALGNGTTDLKVVAGITTNGTAQIVLGVNTTTLGSLKMFGNTSGDVTLSPAAVAGTATALTLPATSDTLVGKATTDTLTNKRVTARITTITSNANPTVNTDNCDVVTITAQAAAITSMTTNLTGTPTNFDLLEYRIKDDGTARAISAWGTSFVAGPTALPTTTVVNKVLHVWFSWDSVQSKWVCLSSGSDA